jgi:3-phosphoshikimate 1-carboxyvinyltransferase
MGARIELADGEHAPIDITGKRPLAGGTHRLNIPSAQLKSAILLAGLFADGNTVVEGAVDTRDHTERMLAWLTDGAAISPGPSCTLQPAPLRGGRRLVVPGDISSAAFLAVAAALLPGSRVELAQVGLNPSRTAYLDVLGEMGVPIARTGTGGDPADWAAGEPVGDLVVEAATRLQAITTAARQSRHLIDEIPILAVAATQAYGRSRFTGLGELRHKESDRLAGVAAGLAAMGATVEVLGDDLVVDGPCRLRGAPVATLGDHRLAMAFTVAGMCAKGETELDDHTCISVSYPGFWQALADLSQDA